MRILGFHHLAIQVHDIEKVAAFYSGVLEFREQVRHRNPDGSLRSIWMGMGEGPAFIALEATTEPPVGTPFRHPRPGLHLLALRISRDDRAAILRRLNEQQIPVEHESRWTVYVRDPEGNRIGLSHHPEDPVVGR
ncbi:MAG: VOC family protein [Myxococcaceae bacterium]